MSTSRNASCPCGSGLKIKHCCDGQAPKNRSSRWTGLAVGLVLLAGLFVVGMALSQGDDGSGPPGPAPPGKVWSPEHGHWHDR